MYRAARDLIRFLVTVKKSDFIFRPFDYIFVRLYHGNSSSFCDNCSGGTENIKFACDAIFVVIK